MLLLLTIGRERYGLPCAEVEAVVPLVPLREVPLAPPWVRGLLRYRGELVPVIDLCRLAGPSPAAELLSTRIVLVTGAAGRPLGLLAEQITDTADEREWIARPTGLEVPGAGFLGDVLVGPSGAVQQVRVAELLTDEVRAILAGACS